MIMEENSNHKIKRNLHKVSLYLLKIIPILLASLAFINTLLGSFGFVLISTITSYIMFFVVYLFLYISSYVFDFCEHHRMFLHYIVTTNLIKAFDYYSPIPLSDFGMLQLYLIITVISLFIILYIYVKNNKKKSTKDNR